MADWDICSSTPLFVTQFHLPSLSECFTDSFLVRRVNNKYHLDAKPQEDEAPWAITNTVITWNPRNRMKQINITWSFYCSFHRESVSLFRGARDNQRTASCQITSVNMELTYGTEGCFVFHPMCFLVIPHVALMMKQTRGRANLWRIVPVCEY